MKLQIVSDLHCEFLKGGPGIDPDPSADALILAGDIDTGARALRTFHGWPVPVIYVAGNHEFYGGEIRNVQSALADASPSHISVLENNVVGAPGVRIIGCTLWTDYEYGGDLSASMLNCMRGMADHHLIRIGGRPFFPSDALALHQRSVSYLAQELVKPFDGATVVVTHHGPHRQSVSPKFTGSPINAGFVSELDDLLPMVDLWIHGHTHDSLDYRIGSCRVIANPRGYPLKTGGFENPNFNPALVVGVGGAGNE